MYVFLPFILSIFLLAGFIFLKKNYRGKEIFLQNSVEQLNLEKIALQRELASRDEIVYQLEKELLEIRRINLELSEKVDREDRENLALRNLLDELQKKQSSKNEDIVVEYVFKP